MTLCVSSTLERAPYVVKISKMQMETCTHPRAVAGYSVIRFPRVLLNKVDGTTFTPRQPDETVDRPRDT